MTQPDNLICLSAPKLSSVTSTTTNLYNAPAGNSTPAQSYSIASTVGQVSVNVWGGYQVTPPRPCLTWP